MKYLRKNKILRNSLSAPTVRTSLRSSFSIILLLAISAFNLNAQSLATFCNNEYGGKLLKMANFKVDSLQELGVGTIYNLNHYVGQSEAGYSKIIWKEHENFYGLIIEIDKVTSEEVVIRTNKIESNELPKLTESLNTINTTIQKEVISGCDGWMSHQPYFLLYSFRNNLANCISVAQSDTECNQQNPGVKLINKLKKNPLEFYRLILTEAEFKKNISNKR